MKVAVIGRAGSDYRKKVDAWLGHVPLKQAQAVFNYGLQGEKFKKFEDANPRLMDLPIFNGVKFGNKYDVSSIVRDIRIPTPRSYKWEDIKANDLNDYPALIAKPFYSLGGRGIYRVNPEKEFKDGRTHYLQEEVTNRRYEVRVHAAAWIDPNEWLFQKRVHANGEDELAWNQHNGGRFITINDSHSPVFERIRGDVIKIMPLLKYQFGAVDFIVQNNPGGKLNRYFLEWNLAPGWTIANTEKWYRNTFTKLTTLSLEDFEAYEAGMLKEDIEEFDAQPEVRYGWINDPIGRIRIDDGPDVEPLGGQVHNGAGIILEATQLNGTFLVSHDIRNRYTRVSCDECNTVYYILNDSNPVCAYCGYEI
jgi:hypothetical protein